MRLKIFSSLYVCRKYFKRVALSSDGETCPSELARANKSIFQPPAPTPKARKGPAAPPAAKLVADPYVEALRPNRIEKLVPYQPCA